MKRVSIGLALFAGASLFIASAAASHAAAGDTVQTTGGGWIIPSLPSTPSSTPSGGSLLPADTTNTKATFGFVASGVVQTDGTLGDFQGELSYHDHGVDLKLHSTSVTQVTAIDATHTSFTGMADVTTPAGTGQSPFTVTVYDGGEPGVGVDTFAIQLSNVFLPGDGGAFYQRQGTLGGGNIQVH